MSLIGAAPRSGGCWRHSSRPTKPSRWRRRGCRAWPRMPRRSPAPAKDPASYMNGHRPGQTAAIPAASRCAAGAGSPERPGGALNPTLAVLAAAAATLLVAVAAFATAAAQYRLVIKENGLK